MVGKVRSAWTYTAHDGPAPPALRDQVSSTLAGLPNVVRPTDVLHVKPVTSSRTIPQRVLPVDGKVVVAAVQSRDEQHLAILQKTPTDRTTCPRQVVERVQVNGRSDANDDSGEPVSGSPTALRVGSP